MIKKTMSLMAVLAFAGTLHAQTPDFKLGAKAGLNLSTLSNLDDTKTKANFHIGAVAEIFINEKFSIQPEILYSAQGAKQSTKDEYLGVIVKTENDIKLDYINIPIMAKYHITDAITIHAGPQIAFNVKAESTGTINSLSKTEDIKEDINSVDIGLGFGAGYQLPLGVFFDLRYNIGLNDAVKESSKSIKNNVFQISVGYKF